MKKTRNSYVGKKIEEQIKKKFGNQRLEILGIDVGGTHYSAQYINKSGELTRLTVKGEKHMIPNLLAAYDKGMVGNASTVLCDYEEVARLCEDEASVLGMFKAAPDSVMSKMRIVKADGSVSNFTNGDAMRISFALAFESILSEHPYIVHSVCDSDGILVVAVGCPSGGGWDAESYADILGAALEEFAKNNPTSRTASLSGRTELAIFHESACACTAEMFERGFSNRESVILCDAGSTSFDITFSVDGKVKYERSCRIGGNNYDLLMLEEVKREYRRHYGTEPHFDEPTKQLPLLRGIKERIFSKKGKGGELSGERYVAMIDGKEFGTVFDGERIGRLIYSTEVPLQGGLFSDGCIYPSFYDAYKSILEDVKSEIAELGLPMPEICITSGGVALMDFFEPCIKSVFGVKSFIEPKYRFDGVARGLAVIARGYTDMLCAKYGLCESYREYFVNKLPDFVNCVADSLADNVLDIMDEKYARWAGAVRDGTLTEVINAFRSEIIMKSHRVSEQVDGFYAKNIPFGDLQLISKRFGTKYFPLDPGSVKVMEADTFYCFFDSSVRIFPSLRNYFKPYAFVTPDREKHLNYDKRQEIYGRFIEYKPYMRNLLIGFYSTVLRDRDGTAQLKNSGKSYMEYTKEEIERRSIVFGRDFCRRYGGMLAAYYEENGAEAES